MEGNAIVRRKGINLVPDTFDSEQLFSKLPRDKPFEITVRTYRNPDQLKLYWVLCGLVAENCDEFDDKDDVDWWTRLSIPWMRKEIRITHKQGDLEIDTISLRPLSIAIGSMTQEKFKAYFDRATELWAEKLGIDVEDLKREGRERS